MNELYFFHILYRVETDCVDQSIYIIPKSVLDEHKLLDEIRRAQCTLNYQLSTSKLKEYFLNDPCDMHQRGSESDSDSDTEIIDPVFKKYLVNYFDGDSYTCPNIEVNGIITKFIKLHWCGLMKDRFFPKTNIRTC